MKEFGNKKQFKLPKLNWGKRKAKERKYEAAEQLLDGWTYPVDEMPIEAGMDEGEIYMHILETDTWVWLDPELAFCYGELLCQLADMVAEEKLGES